MLVRDDSADFLSLVAIARLSFVDLPARNAGRNRNHVRLGVDLRKHPTSSPLLSKVEDRQHAEPELARRHSGHHDPPGRHHSQERTMRQ